MMWRVRFISISVLMALLVCVQAGRAQSAVTKGQAVESRIAPDSAPVAPVSAEYRAVQKRLAQGWNTWDVHSVTTQVLLPEGLAIRVGMQHNTTENSDPYLGDALI